MAKIAKVFELTLCPSHWRSICWTAASFGGGGVAWGRTLRAVLRAATSRSAARSTASAALLDASSATAAGVAVDAPGVCGGDCTPAQHTTIITHEPGRAGTGGGGYAPHGMAQNVIR